MRILFVENKFKTPFWAAVAAQLQVLSNAEIGWLVQNPLSPGTFGQRFRLPLPDAKDLSDAPLLPWHERIARGDRNIQHFGGNARHYWHYTRHIQLALDAFQPDLVVGESTLFHELITIELARQRSIPFLQPSTCRYPVGRFSIYRDDTLETVGGSGETLSDKFYRSFLEHIRHGRVKPDYMSIPQRREKWALKVRLAKNAAFGIASWLAGERFNTPSPMVKQRLNSQLEANKARWEALADSHVQALERSTPDACPILLYPLQMQPEANLDVWGAPWSDQTSLVRQLADLLPRGWKLAIKPNPKSKYEMSSSLCKVAEADSRILAISHTRSMQDVLPLVAAIFGITGTINLEAVFKDIPCFTPALPLIRDHAPERFLSHLSDLTLRLSALERGNFSLPDRSHELLFALVGSSFAGYIGDPIWTPSYLAKENIENVASAIISVSN